MFGAAGLDGSAGINGAGTGAAGEGFAGLSGGAGIGGAGIGGAGIGGAGVGAAGTDGAAGTVGAPPGDCGVDSFACRGAAPTMATALGTAKGPYTTGNITSGYKDGTGFADATIYYPMGDAVPPFACVAVVPGFVSPQSSIQNWGPFLASHGIVTITIGTNTPQDQPAVRATALMDALVTCKAENDRAGSPMMGKISQDHAAIAGWSMGGGGALMAASANPTLKAAIGFAAWGPTGGDKDTVPVLAFEGTADALAAGMSEAYYAAIPASTPKMLFEVQGAPHEVANDPANSMGIIGLYGLSWFKVFLEGDGRYRQFLTAGKPSIATAKYDTNVK
jgi:dienelactone hydrolase